ncbi:MAG: hypothetical protein KAY32_16375 [Candidatus Eisenbacteria sp.]|nr:hypothetical protein [Candidatus Eisenbacteria bacterium]
MSKPKNAMKAKTPKTRKPNKLAADTAAEMIVKTVTASEEPKKASRDGLCVFAFRLTPEERTAIHKAAGPAKASKFARSLLVAAARNDAAAVKAIMKAVQSKA